MGRYLSDEALKNIKAHKYSVENLGILNRFVLRHYWDFVLNHFIPSWMA